MDSFFVSAPGKVILFGEHAVVHEKAAVATTVSLRSYLLVQSTTSASTSTPRIRLHFPDINLDHTWSLTELPHLPITTTTPTAPTSLDPAILTSLDPLLEPFAKKEFQHVAVYAFLYLYISLARPPTGDVTFLLRSAIPIGSGLGSSASISVCLATALLIMGGHIPRPNGGKPQKQKTTEETPDNVDAEVLKTINGWAYLGEKCIHGNPSGVDNTVATFGGGVVFRKERRERKLSNGTFTASKPAEKIIIRIPTLRFLLTDTNHPRRTAILVAHVATLLTTLPAITPHILTAIDGIAAEAKRLFQAVENSENGFGDSVEGENITTRLGELISINQGLLNSVGVGHEKLDAVARITKDIGWTKLTGAGGGGCALTLLKEDTTQKTLQKTEVALRAQGFKPFEVELGGQGVGILETVSDSLADEFTHSIGSVAKELHWVYWG